MSQHALYGMQLLSQGRAEMAEQEFRQALSQDPDDGELHAWLAASLDHQDKHEDARVEAERAVGIEPDNPFCHAVHATALANLKNMHKAEIAILEAIRLDPEDPDSHGTLAHIYQARRYWDKALDEAERGLSLDPDHVACTNVRAMALMHLDREDEAGETVRQALAKDPENKTTHANQGWRLLHQGKAKEALTHFQEALRRDPDFEWARKGMIEALKARYWSYGLMLRFMLWLGSMSRGRQWAFLIGLIVLVQVVGRLGDAYPGLEIYASIVILLYMSFVIMNWMSDAFFNLLLRMHPIGKHALNREERRASLWVLAGIFYVAGCLLGLNCIGLRISLWEVLFVSLVFLPISGVYKCNPGTARFLMGLAAVSIAILYPASYLILMGGNVTVFHQLQDVYLWGCVLSTWAVSILNSRY